MQNPTNKTAPPLPSSARLIVADGCDLARESMRLMLEEEPYLRILDEAKDGQEAIELGRLHRPDLVLMEVCMPRVNGFEATRMIKAELSATKVLIVSAYENLVFISEAIRAGADGYVLKLAPLEVLLEAVRGVLGGESRYPSKYVELG
jgi:DNA-binding NarL/FixJ family response regulator